MIVIDASAAIDILINAPRSARLTAAIRDDTLIAPELIDVEVCSALARIERSGVVTGAQADELFDLFLGFPLQRMSHRDLRGESWKLRHSVRISDSFYLACGIALDTPILTVDRRLMRVGVAGARFVSID
jgi:predicted nucleic acid-binding protein